MGAKISHATERAVVHYCLGTIRVSEQSCKMFDNSLIHQILYVMTYTFFFYKNMLSRSEPQKEIEIATSKITTMFLNFGKFEPQRSYKHGSYKKKKCNPNGPRAK